MQDCSNVQTEVDCETKFHCTIQYELCFKNAVPAEEKENNICVLLFCSCSLRIYFTLSRTGLTVELSFKKIKNKANIAGLAVCSA